MTTCFPFPSPATVCRHFPQTALWAMTLWLTWVGAGNRGIAASPPLTPEGFQWPQSHPQWSFPRDHGSHSRFKIEWWYVTGHLWGRADSGSASNQFGFQATFFRRATAGGGGDPGTPANPLFGNEQVHLAHMALLDVSSGAFIHQERLNRDGWNASSSTNGLKVFNGNWSLEWVSSVPDRMIVRGGIRSDAAFQLSLEAQKPLVEFGTNGISRKAQEPWACSHYLTFSRLAARGSLSWKGRTFDVSGQAWMDHEISSGQLGSGQVGWDWACLQLHDGREIMAYRMRREDGTTDPFSTLAWVDESGRVSHQSPGPFSWEVVARWKSPRTQAMYPSQIRLRCRDPKNGEERQFWIQPLAADQELIGGMGGVTYWEGACRVLDERLREVGHAFLEMTGYATPFRGQF